MCCRKIAAAALIGAGVLILLLCVPLQCWLVLLGAGLIAAGVPMCIRDRGGMDNITIALISNEGEEK